MQSLRCLALCALMSVAGSGCATYLNLQDQSHATTSELNIWETPATSTPKSVYGGVAMDAEFGRGLLTNPTEHDPRAVPLGLYALFVDLPLSAIGDTLTLPITVPAAIQRRADEPDETVSALNMPKHFELKPPDANSEPVLE